MKRSVSPTLPTTSSSTSGNLVKKARNAEVSYRTAQRWAGRGAFDYDSIQKDLEFLSDDNSDNNSDTPSDESPNSSSKDSLVSELNDSNINISSDSSDSSSSDSEGSVSSQTTEENCDEPLNPDLVGSLEGDNEVEAITVSFDSDDEVEVPTGVIQQRNSIKLHDYTSTTVEEAVLSFMLSFLNNNKTKSCLAEDLKVLHSVLPVPNNMPKSLYHLLKFVNSYAPPCSVTKHYCCGNCQLYQGTKQLAKCPACENLTSIMFCIIDIQSQIKHLFECRGLPNILRKANERENIDLNVFSDIVYGSEYKRVNCTRKPFDLTLVLSTDGTAIKRSSRADFWPVTFTIAEIPYTMRNLFITCAGVWYARKKPEMNTFLIPIAVELKKLGKVGGITWKDPETDVQHTSNVSAPLIIGDAPARSDLLHMQNHNGKHGCITCEIKIQKITKVDGERRRRVYKVKDELQLRSKERMIVMGREAQKQGKIIKGVKGRTVVSLLPGVDESTVVFGEFMHSVCLGVIKQVLLCWIGTKPGDSILKDFLPEIDVLIVAIKPPSQFSRMPRPVSQCTDWKAYEYLYWGLFYSVLVIEALLKKFEFEEKVQKIKPYLEHWKLFVIAISILMKGKVTNDDLERAESHLKLFVEKFESFYSEKELTYNLHQMLHLCLHVKRWGPTWGTSAFSFENFIGLMGKSVHGNNNVAVEITSRIKILQGVQSLKCVVEMRNISDQNVNVCLGQVNIVELTQYILHLLNSTGFSQDCVSVFSRARINRCDYTSKLYKDLQTIDYCVGCKLSEEPRKLIGAIECFIQRGNNIYVVLNTFTVNQETLLYNRETRTRLESFIPIQKDDRQLKVINLESVTSICKLLLHDDFVCVVPKPLRNKSVVM